MFQKFMVFCKVYHHIIIPNSIIFQSQYKILIQESRKNSVKTMKE